VDSDWRHSVSQSALATTLPGRMQTAGSSPCAPCWLSASLPAVSYVVTFAYLTLILLLHALCRMMLLLPTTSWCCCYTTLWNCKLLDLALVLLPTSYFTSSRKFSSFYIVIAIPRFRILNPGILAIFTNLESQDYGIWILWFQYYKFLNS